MNSVYCTVGGCGRPARASGLCQAHYLRQRRGGTSPRTPVEPRGKNTICIVEGCEKPARSRGYCVAHYERWRKAGDPGEAAIGSWRRSRVFLSK